MDPDHALLYEIKCIARCGEGAVTITRSEYNTAAKWVRKTVQLPAGLYQAQVEVMAFAPESFVRLTATGKSAAGGIAVSSMKVSHSNFTSTPPTNEKWTANPCEATVEFVTRPAYRLYANWGFTFEVVGGSQGTCGA